MFFTYGLSTMAQNSGIMVCGLYEKKSTISKATFDIYSTGACWSHLTNKWFRWFALEWSNHFLAGAETMWDKIKSLQPKILGMQ